MNIVRDPRHSIGNYSLLRPLYCIPLGLAMLDGTCVHGGGIRSIYSCPTSPRPLDIDTENNKNLDDSINTTVVTSATCYY